MSSSGNVAILVIMEYLTRYLITVPLSDETAVSVGKAFILNVFLKFGSPKYILTDQGTNFESEFMHVLL